MTGLSLLMVTPRFEPSSGGVETHVREVGSRLASRGHQVTLIAGDPAGDLAPEEGLHGMRVLRVGTLPRDTDLMLAPGLPALIRRIPADLVHVQSWHTLMAPVAMASSTALGRPTVLTFHSGGHSSALREAARGVQLLALRPWLRAADRLVAVSAFEAAALAGRLRLRRSRFTVVPNGAELPVLDERPARDPDLVLSVGRLEAYKGHEVAIRALAPLSRVRPAVRLRIVGAGPDEHRLRSIAEETGVADRVSIEAVPAGDGAAMAGLLASAGAVALLSRYESQGISAYEAVGAGARVVVRDETALAELVEREWAAGVRPAAEPDEVAEALEAALSAEPPDRAPVVPTWDAATDGLEALYRDVLDGRRR